MPELPWCETVRACIRAGSSSRRRSFQLNQSPSIRQRIGSPAMRRWWCLADGCQVQTGVDGGIDLVFSFGEAFLAVNNHGVFFSKIFALLFSSARSKLSCISCGGLDMVP